MTSLQRYRNTAATVGNGEMRWEEVVQMENDTKSARDELDMKTRELYSHKQYVHARCFHYNDIPRGKHNGICIIERLHS